KSARLQPSLEKSALFRCCSRRGRSPMREPNPLKSRARSWGSPEQQFQMRAHERAHVERRESLEQAGPNEGHEPWRDQQLRKPGERIMRELALLYGEPQSFAHRRQHARNNFTIIELRQLRE